MMRALQKARVGLAAPSIRDNLLALGALLALPLIWFAPVLFPALSGLSLLPYDNLYEFEPWRSLQPGVIPHNSLLSDLVLENTVWKLHIRRTLAEGQLPLWNPQIFAGLPFLAAGQASVFYPLSALFYVVNLETAYGWFTALQIAWAGIAMYLWGRSLRLGVLPALAAGVIFQASGFLMVSVVFTMFLAAAAWLPFILAVIETVIRKQEEKGLVGFTPIPYITAGAIAIGCMVLAGHPELIYYTLLVAGVYTLIRLGVARRYILQEQSTQAAPPASSSLPPALLVLTKLAAWILVMAVLGITLGAVQLLPLLELVPQNFREGSASLRQVLDWAWPTRHVLTFFVPNIFGNPSHHAWFDLWQGEWIPATVNAEGEANHTIFWGIKNYVEGGAYLSITAWLLAGVALIYGIAARRADPATWPIRPWIIWFCVGLALISLLFAFGTPLYAVLYYGLPGWNQLHSPFRWVFPFTLSMAILAGVGLHVLLQPAAHRTAEKINWLSRGSHLLAGSAMLAGVGVLALVAISRFVPDPFIALGRRIIDGSDLAQLAFADGRMFWGYQALNLLQLGGFSFLAGLGVWLLARNLQVPKLQASSLQAREPQFTNSPSHQASNSGRPGRQYALSLVLIALIALDLWLAHGHFNPAVPIDYSPRTAEARPDVVDFIAEQEGVEAPLGPTGGGIAWGEAGPWRYTTFNLPGEKTFNANVGMYYGWHDIRGYDSIILGQYADFMEQIAPQSNELLYNRIAPLYSDAHPDPYAALNNPLLDLLNVKYVLTEHYLPNPGWQEIYRDPGIAVYENQTVQPRAFIVPEARVAPRAEQPLAESDLRQVVYLEETPGETNSLTPAAPQVAEARISRYTANDVFIDINLSDRGWLVLSDAYFPGWQAYLRPFGGTEGDETELNLYRANGAFRTVYLPAAGQWTVRFNYSPMSFKLGLYASFLAAMTLFMLLLYWGWGKYYRPESTAGEVRTVAKNSLVPMGLNLLNKAIDFAFAMLYVRMLGPVGTGQFAFVIALYGLFEIISRYGLGTLLTREVAGDKNLSSRYLTNVIALRTLLWLVALPLLGLVTYGYTVIDRVPLFEADSIGRVEVQAIALLGLAMLFANWADAFSSMFYAFEKMEYPAGLTNAVALLKVTLGALVLLLGWGIVGLAAVSLLMNVLQTLWLYGLMRRTLFRPQWQWDWPLQMWMLRTSSPLMLNHLLATIFWRIDLWILRPLAGAASVGLYSVGLKYLDGLNIVPSVFTLAIFPLMSRYARREGDSLLRAYVISLRLLVIVSLPIAMLVTILAQPLVWLVGGGEYLNVAQTYTFWGRSFTVAGGSDLALRIIIWSIPIGFVNSVTQYVLIAVNQQHYLTRAFILGVVFNVAGNLLAIPTFGYAGAAFITILSEFSLLIPFYWSVRRHVGVVPWFSIFGGPVPAVLLMGAGAWLLIQGGINVWLAAALGGLLYPVGLLATGVFHGEDMAVVRRALPWSKSDPAAIQNTGPETG